MFKYYVQLALSSIMRSKVHSLLTMLTIALGIGACTITLTLVSSMSANPISHKSEQLFRVQLDNWDPNQAAISPDLPPEFVTWTDANNIVNAKQAKRQSASAITWGMVNPTEQGLTPFLALMRVTSKDFFPMFDVPFIYGAGWDESAEQNNDYVVVLSKETNQRVFNGVNSVGKTLTMLGATFTVVGVLDDWHMSPKFYDMSYGAFSAPEDIYLPLGLKAVFELPHGGITSCWKPIESQRYDAFLHSECINFQLWVELEDGEQKAQFNQYLTNYVTQQKTLGRFPRPLNNRLVDVTQWLEYKQVVKQDIQVMFWLSVMFLLVCLINAASLLSAKLHTKHSEIGLRRALGANFSQIILQYSVEIVFIGLCGGILGVLLAIFGLQGVASLYAGYGQLIELDLTVVTSVIALAVVGTIIAGLIPVYSACRPAPAMQIKQ
ncbi:ABC transporter permease [Paraglaciecola chathamensis]|uniref:ABC transporter ATP-binding protein n=1 Tax=Paraglaciecola agarilytica NO2 TaxID=1125747 RepID=A0ABQ0ICT1_9ALTE|nr:ABC transporter permease [Paraglaciecola agarilytica]GAC07192.1 ABC transporter ATP-binding protein [Paraglaciecola agarilytica NO2]